MPSLRLRRLGSGAISASISSDSDFLDLHSVSVEEAEEADEADEEEEAEQAEQVGRD